MSDEKANFMTHDNIGKKPTINLWFPVIWTNTGPDDHVRNKGMSVISTPNLNDWDSFRRDLFAPFGHSNDDLVTYIDSDDDQIPIESQCEFEEALKIATKLATKKPPIKSLYLVVDRGYEPRTENTKKKIPVNRSNSLVMAPTNLNDDVQNIEKIQPQNEINCNAKELETSDETPPKWFTNYMQTMKEDIITEVSKRVTKTMTETFEKKRENQYDSANSHQRTSDLEYFVDSDSDDFRTKFTGMNLTDGNKNSLRCDNNSRRRYRNLVKPRKRQNKCNVSQSPNNTDTSSQRYHNSSPLNNRRRGEKVSIKRDIQDSRGRLSQSCFGNTVNSEKLLTPTKYRDFDNISDEFDTPYRRMIASGIKQMSFTPVDATDLPEAPILKLRLANSCENDDSNAETKVTDDKLRMGCSITGNDVIDKPNDAFLEYCALSDSDNISIISDVSHNSDIQRISNGFEMIIDRAINFPDETDCERDQPTMTKFEEKNNEEQAKEDPYANRDSSSFELLSEPTSPPLSIRMDEDHFSGVTSETKNYNTNDDTSINKRGNQKIMESSILAIDVQGKIYQCNIIETNENDNSEIILEKRTDGTYSFVADTLPGSTKESMIKTFRKDFVIDEKINDDDDNVSENEYEDEKTTKNPKETNLDGNCTDYFHESTQSFHSHTIPQTENERQNFAEYSSVHGHDELPSTTRSHIFMDENASKGLGDTIQSSPRRQEFLNKSHDDFSSEMPKTSRKPSNSSNNGFSGKRNGYSEQGSRKFSNRNNSSNNGSSGRRNGYTEQGARTRRFPNWSTTHSTRIIDDFVLNNVDPMHILPETLVTGAVHVAASAYTTARRVYNKILTAQTRKPADKSKFGRR